MPAHDIARNVRRSPTVFTLPKTRKNPYLILLAQHLEAAGVTVLPDARLGPSALLGGARPDFVHYHWPSIGYSSRQVLKIPLRATRFFTQLALLRRAGIRIAWTFHNRFPHEFTWPAFQHWARRRMVESTDLLFVHFQGAADYLRDTYGRTTGVYVVPHGSYRGFYEDVVSREEARQYLGLEPEAFAFLHFGALRPYKGTEGVISAFRKLPGDSLRLVVAGEPWNKQYLASLREAAAGDRRITLLARRIPDGEVQHLMRASDVFVMGQPAFTTGSAVLAFDFDLPVVAWPVNHLAEIAKGNALVPVGQGDEDEPLLDAMMRATRLDLGAARADARSVSDSLRWEETGRLSAEAFCRHLDA